MATVVTKKTLEDTKIPAFVMPLTQRYTPPDVRELNNQRAMNGGKTDKKPDLRGLPELIRIDGQASGFGERPLMHLVKDVHISVLQKRKFLMTSCQVTAVTAQARGK